ncbi:MAG: hypothetical protein WAK17_00930 [Candidatus Nitrosopolaris sp.]
MNGSRTWVLESFSRIIKYDLNGWLGVVGGQDHIVFVYNFLPIGRDVSEMIDTSKQLSKFAR